MMGNFHEHCDLPGYKQSDDQVITRKEDVEFEVAMHTDYKNLLKTMQLTTNQKKMLFALCSDPTAHPYSSKYKLRHTLSSGGIEVALKRLQDLKMVVKNDAGVWCIRNSGMQTWLYALHTARPLQEVDPLRFGNWP